VKRATSKVPTDYPIELFADEAGWLAWLEAHHATAPGLWLRIARVSSSLSSVTFAEALDGALCYGWIDGQRRSHDDESYLQKFTPRGRRSGWSKRNREHVERLTAAGRMRPAGVAAVEAARADGRWARAYDSPATAIVPDDLAAALDAHPGARALFETLRGMRRYSILYNIQTAVRPETRARRIERYVEMLKRGEVPS
jgi:uncharacterized protein YdeI (YjbR/CyaY-like superfamily)